MILKANTLVFVLIFLKASWGMCPVFMDQWVIWNVGQGLWVTHVLPEKCLHYDMGGEPNALREIKSALLQKCGLKKNQLYLSHWDLDHTLHIAAFSRLVPFLCWGSIPAFQHEKKSAQKILGLNLKTCEPDFEIQKWLPQQFKKANDSSAVFQEQKILLPGDSTISQEYFWSRQMKGLAQVKVLILGHHGSRTSTGAQLLARLTDLKMTIASARYQKYRHPNFFTVQRVQKRRSSVLKTEDWGNIIIRF
jgi:competence protein ComEC